MAHRMTRKQAEEIHKEWLGWTRCNYHSDRMIIAMDWIEHMVRHDDIDGIDRWIARLASLIIIYNNGPHD